MRFKFALASAALILSASISHAATFAIPTDHAAATVDIPDTWKPHNVEGGVEGASIDGRVYVFAQAIHGKDAGAAAEAGANWFETQGVKLDEKTLVSKDVEINGVKGFNMNILGVDKIGKTQVSMTFFATKDPEEFVLVSIWGDEVIEGDNLTDVGSIVSSIRPTN